MNQPATNASVPSPDDLLSRALEYLQGTVAPAGTVFPAGTVDASATLAFEEQLATDQAAREALAQAVELSAACWVVEHDAVEQECETTPAWAAAMAPRADVTLVPAQVELSISRQVAGWIAVASAACLACTIVWQSLPSTTPSTGETSVAQQAPLPAESLALAWAQAASALAHDAPHESDLANRELEEDVTLALADATSTDEPAAPSWIFAAVEARRAAIQPEGVKQPEGAQ